MMVFASETVAEPSGVGLWLTAGIVIGAVVAWAVTQILNVSTIRKNQAEIRDKTRQLQESLDERERQYADADRECGKYFGRLLALVTENAPAREIAAVRDALCTCLNTMVMPTYAQLVRRRFLYSGRNREQIAELVAATTKEVRDWQDYMAVVNDPVLLELANQSPNTISKHELIELRRCVSEIAVDSKDKDFLLEELGRLIESGMPSQ